MTLLFADENITPTIVQGLRDRGVDIMTTTEAGIDNQKTSDPEILRYAGTLGRAVITFNRKDFKQLHEEGEPHAGILLLKQNTPIPLLIEKIADLALSSSDLGGALHRIVQP